MIFKHLFTPKWKHPKTQIRAQALEKLDVAKDQHILATMAKEDVAPELRRQALGKLNNIGLWWHAFKQDNALKEVAEQQILSNVIHDVDTQHTEIKAEYIDKFAAKKVLEKLALSDKNLDVRVKLLRRLADKVLIEKAFKEASEELQMLLLPLVEQYAVQKQVIKAAKEQPKLVLESQIEALRFAQEMPEKVSQEVKLVLAKLNYLREKFDYEQLMKDVATLTADWQQIELKWLPETELAAVKQKFDVLSEKLNNHIAKLKVQFVEEQQRLDAEQAKAELEQECEAHFKRVMKLASNTVDLADETVIHNVQSDLRSLLDKLKLAEIRENKKAEMVGELNKMADELQQFPRISSQIQTVRSLLKALDAVVVPESIDMLDVQVNEFDKIAYQIKSELRVLPKSFAGELSAEFTTRKRQFEEAIKPHVEAQNELLRTAKKKAFDTKRLIQNGRFNVAFGVFKGFIHAFELLTPTYQGSLETIKSELDAQLADLEDWQKYATAPKREEILSDVEALLGDSDLDPAKRATRVKQLRQRWSECGPLLSDEMKTQAEQFEHAIEKAFEPCREFFAKQEQLRSEFAEQRKDLILQIQQLAVTAQSEGCLKTLESDLNRLKSQWKNAGKVDVDTYQKLNNKFKAEQDKVWAVIKAHYSRNAQAKSELLEAAKAQSEHDNIQQACENLKQIQQQWQHIGFAGAKQEHKLWQAFRAINDSVFANRQALFDEKKREQAQQNQVLAEQFNLLKDQFEVAATDAEFKALRASTEALTVHREIKTQVKTLLDDIDLQLTKFRNEAEQANVDELIQALATDELPSNWKMKVSDELSSHELLLRLEILHEIESPAQDKEARVAVQVAMLEEKLSGGEFSKEQTLLAFVNSCSLPLDTPSIARIKACLLK
ncbi:hypothetical protein PALB_31000 [Pseudoalteromonas luteoviolacea B = ATCC 29581]|nr:hypothetical protein PALB_31000 [Pseudoalteromonas luteoviolacea B = ATCC 29581]